MNVHRIIQLLLLAASCLILSGCSVSFSTSSTPKDEPTRAGLQGALDRYYKAMDQNDENVFCSMISRPLLNKFAASYELFNADCAQVLAAVAKQQKGLTAAERGDFVNVKVDGDSGEAVLRFEYDGRTVREEILLERRGGQWMLVDTRMLDELAPRKPAVAYRAYVRAVVRGDGAVACGLMTDRGQGTMAEAGAKAGDGVTSCETAVPVLATRATSIPDPEVTDGAIYGDEATLSVLQPDGRGRYILRFIYMKRVQGRWLFDYSKDIGKTGSATPKSQPNSAPV